MITDDPDLTLSIELLRTDSYFEPETSFNSSVGFSVGGMDFDIRLPSDEYSQTLTEWYGPFLCRPGNGVRLQYLLKDQIPPAVWDECERSRLKFNRVQVVPEAEWLRESEVGVFRWDFRCIVSKQQEAARVLLLANSAPSVDAVARVAASLIFPDNQGLLIHGASIEKDGRGFLFMGVSGSGKSTLAEISGQTVLNDEISLLTLEEGEVSIQGTPFYGDLKQGANLKLPLGGIYLLQQDHQTCLENLPEFEQTVRFLRNVLTFSSDVASFDLIQSLVQSILKKHQLQILHFEKNRKFLEVLS